MAGCMGAALALAAAYAAPEPLYPPNPGSISQVHTAPHLVPCMFGPQGSSAAKRSGSQTMGSTLTWHTSPRGSWQWAFQRQAAKVRWGHASTMLAPQRAPFKHAANRITQLQNP